MHLVDGTYELFRQHFGLPAEVREKSVTAATRGVVGHVLRLLEEGVTHIGVATDRVIESFRNRMWPSYKDSTGVAPALVQQLAPVGDALETLGVQVWAMVDLEADDALASAASALVGDERVAQVAICTPDKDLAQCVVGDRVVQHDHRKDVTLDEAGVRARFGVDPPSVPDWLALVGDSSDGYPGIKGWGPATSAAVLRRYGHLESIPRLGDRWDVDVRGARSLAASLRDDMELALLFRDLATLRLDETLCPGLDSLRWRGPTPAFAGTCERLGAPALLRRAEELAAAHAGR